MLQGLFELSVGVGDCSQGGLFVAVFLKLAHQPVRFLIGVFFLKNGAARQHAQRDCAVEDFFHKIGRKQQGTPQFF